MAETSPPPPISRISNDQLSGARRAFLLFMVQGLPALGLGYGVWLFLREGIRGLDPEAIAARVRHS